MNSGVEALGPGWQECSVNIKYDLSHICFSASSLLCSPCWWALKSAALDTFLTLVLFLLHVSDPGRLHLSTENG